MSPGKEPSLLLAALLAADDLPKVKVSIPEWGIEEAYIRTMTGLERDQFEASNVERLPDGSIRPLISNISARLVAKCLIDKDGERIVPNDKVEALGSKSSKVLARLFRVAQQVNGMGSEAAEQVAKN